MQKLTTGAAYQFTSADGYAPAMGPLPTVLIVHGWKSEVFTGKVYFALALVLQSIGYHTMMLSLRGHQASDGDIAHVNRANHLGDIYAALAYLRNRPEVDDARIGGFGASYGGYLLACSTAPFNLMALRAPALYPDDVWDKPTTDLVARPDRVEWRTQVRAYEESNALKGIYDFPGHLLIIGSEKDEDMPPQVLESYRQAAGRAQSYHEHIIQGADHRLNEAQLAEFLRVNQTWFTEKYPQRR